MKEKMILLFSGGIDSYAAWHYLNKPQTLYIDAKTKYSEKEIKVVRRLVPDTLIDTSLDLHDREQGEKAYVPFRNLLFACLAAKYSDTIVIAGVKDDVVSDKNEKIFGQFTKLLSKLENRDIRVESPFWDMTKSEVVEWFLKTVPGARYLIHETTSCYHPTKTYCGACPSCFRKWCALWDNGLKTDFFDKELMYDYYKAAKSGKYDRKRNKSIIKSAVEFMEIKNGRNMC